MHCLSENKSRRGRGGGQPTWFSNKWDITGSVLVTNGSGRPKNIRIQIRMWIQIRNTNLDTWASWLGEIYLIKNNCFSRTTTKSVDKHIGKISVPGRYTVTRPYEVFRHSDRMAPESTVRGRENDSPVRLGYIHPRIPRFSGVYGIFRRFTLWRKDRMGTV